MLSLLSGSVALGADFTWDASGGTPLNDGGGAWNATGGTNWFDGTNYGAWGNTSADAATFGVANGAAGTITVGNVTANALTFNAPGSGNYTLSSGAITLAGALPTITVNASGTTTISSVLTGSSGLTKSGTGTLSLSAANSYTGVTTVNAGMLRMGNLRAFGSFINGRPVTQVIVNNGGAIDLNGVVDATYGYTISGSGAAGAGAIVNNGASISNGVSQMSNLRLAADASIGGSGNFGLLTNGYGSTTLDLNGNTLTKVGSNNFFLTNTTVTAGTGGAIRVSSGTFSLDAGGAGTGWTAAGANLSGVAFSLDNVAGAGLVLNNIALSLGSMSGGGATGGNVTLGSGTLTVGALGTSTTYSGTIGGTGGLVKTGSGTLVLSASNTYAAPTTINAGSLQLGSGGSAGSVAGNISVVSGANLSFNRSDAMTYGGVISGSGSVTNLGSGTVTLSNANTYTGVTTVNAGVIKIGNVSALGALNTAVTKVVVNAGGAIDLNGQIDATYGYTISGSGVDGTGALVNTGAAIGTSSRQTTNVKLGADAAIGGSANWCMLASGFGPTALDLNGFMLTKTGVNTIFLANTTIQNSGTIAIAQGTLSQLSSGATGTGATILLSNTSGATLDLNGLNLTIGALAGGGSSGGNVINAATLTTGGLNTSTTYAGAITGVGALVKVGTGTMTLTGANTYSGATTISGGALEIGGSGVLNSGAYAATITNSSSFMFSSSANQTLSGAISGPGNIHKSGSGTLTLSTANTYTGGTLLSQGVLALGNNSALGTGTLTFAGGAIRPTAGRAVSNAIVAAAATSSNLIDGGTGDLFYTGTATGSGTLIANSTASRSMALQGDWSGFTGEIQFNINNDGTNYRLGGTPGTLTINADTNGSNFSQAKFVLSGAVDGNRALAWLGLGGATVQIGELSGSGGRISNQSSANWQIGSLNTSSTASVRIDNGATGVSSLTKVGSGTLTLNGPSTYTGTTTVNAGMLRMGNSNAFGAHIAGRPVTQVVVNPGGTVDFNGTRDAMYGYTISGSGANGTGALVNNGEEINNDTAQTTNIRLAGDAAIGGTSNWALLTAGYAATSLDLNGFTLTKLGSNRVSLANTTILNTGTIAVASGTLALVANATTGTGATIALANTAGVLLELNNRNMTIGALSGGGAIGGNVVLGSGTLFVGSLGTKTTFAGAISGSGGVRVGSGFLTLAGLNTYTGATDVLAGGTLAVNGSLANASLTVASGATLMGSGTIAGLTTIAGMHLPGNSPGVETFTNLTYNSGANVQWELWGNTASNSPTTAFDQVVVNGNLTFAGATTLDLVFSGSAGPSSFSSVNWANAFWDSNQEWLLYDVAGAIASANNLTLNVTNWQDSTGAFFQTARPGSSFSVEQRASDVYIVYAAVPEPGTLVLAGVGVAAVVALRCRRRRRVAA